MGDSDEPISILIDELRNEDISSRLKSMSKVNDDFYIPIFISIFYFSFQQLH